MWKHRFQEHVQPTSPGPAQGSMVGRAFVSMPVCQFACGLQMQQQIQDIYRLAAERVREQLHLQRPFELPAFSLN